MQAETSHYLMASAFTLVGAFVVFLGFLKLKRYLLVKDTPRSKIRSLAIGLVEIHGSIDSHECKFIKAPFSKTDCVYYKYKIEEYRRHSSGSGKNRRTTYRWESVASGDKGIPFLARDDTGTVYVDPDGAETFISLRNGYYQKGEGLFRGFTGIRNLMKLLKDWDGIDTTGLRDLDSMNLQPLAERGAMSMTRVGDRKYLEYFIKPGDNLFLLGTAANDRNVPNGVLIKKGKNEKVFIISDSREKGVLKELKKLMLVALIFGSIFFIVGVVMFLKIGSLI